MFELIFVWFVAALAFGFGAIMLSLFVKSALSGLSRLVFIDAEEVTNHVNVSGQSPA